MNKQLKTKKLPKVTNAQFGVILEDVQDKFELVLEGHSALEKKIDDFKDETKTNFKTLFGFVDATTANFKSIFEYLEQIDDEIKSIKEETNIIRMTLIKKADIERLGKLEVRVARMEAFVEKSRLQK